MALLRVGLLPDDGLAAAARFHEDILPRALAMLDKGDDLTLIFAAADHTHRGWRLAAVQGLAREYAPARVNAIAGADERAIAATMAYLDAAPGLTGQYLPLAGTGTAKLLSEDR